MDATKREKQFIVTVNRDAISPSLFTTDEASSIEIRDTDGMLLMLLVMVPNHPVLLASSADEDKDFEQFAKNMGFKMKV